MSKTKGKMKERKINRPKTRKEQRKEQRKLKKQRRLEYYTNRRKPGRFVLLPKEDEVPNQHPGKNTKKITKQKGKNPSELMPQNCIDIENEKRKQIKLQQEMKRQRNKQLQQANLNEDRNIKKLEKQLKLNKRKSTSVPKSFISEGLDYLLEVCDLENMKGIATTEQYLNDINDEFDEDIALMTDCPVKKVSNKKINSASSDAESSVDGSTNSDDESYFSDKCYDISNETEKLSNTLNESKDNKQINKKRKLQEVSIPSKRQAVSENSDSSDCESNISKNSEDNGDDYMESDNNIYSGEEQKDDTWEDIYGRLRGRNGSIIHTNAKKYIPPAMRSNIKELPEDNQRIEKLNRLKKQLKGLLNRLAEANMHSIATQTEELYMNNSRNDMNDTITGLMLDSLNSNVITPERLLIEHVLLITILHANVGTEVGAHFLQTIVKQFDSLFNSKQEVEDKTLDNTINVIAQLYNFKIFNATLMYDILSKLNSKFDEKCVECILAILKSVGFSLRKDSPLAFKSLILDLQSKASNTSQTVKENPRIKFMLDVLLAIKNNNISKIPNYDTSYSEHLKKLQRNFIRKGNYVTQLNISLEDLLRAEERGRWWIVGSAWTGMKDENAHSDKDTKTEQYSDKLLELARKQRMNTDTRRCIFCIIMSAEDYLDAFEKLLRLGLKNQQEREIIHVILHCCLQENKFNPYYAVLSQKFCEYDRKYQMTIKCSIWDKLKALTDCSPSQISNLAKLLTHLFLEKGLPISTLKIMQFSELDKITLRFIRQILLGILLCDDLESCTGVFEKVAQSEKLKMFKESLRLFISHFLLKNLTSDSIPENKRNLLKTRADIVQKILTTGKF